MGDKPLACWRRRLLEVILCTFRAPADPRCRPGEVCMCGRLRRCWWGTTLRLIVQELQCSFVPRRMIWGSEFARDISAAC